MLGTVGSFFLTDALCFPDGFSIEAILCVVLEITSESVILFTNIRDKLFELSRYFSYRMLNRMPFINAEINTYL